MKKYTLIALLASLLYLPCTDASAETVGQAGFEALKKCVMQNDAAVCHNVITPSSYELVDRFISYKLMPCLPTNFSYANETTVEGYTVVRATMPAPDNRQHMLRLAFTGSETNPQLDVPKSLEIGMGEKWQEKIQMAESLFLMLRMNAGSTLTCDQLEGLVKK